MINIKNLPEFEVDLDLFETNYKGDTDTKEIQIELENGHYMVRFDAKITVECVYDVVEIETDSFEQTKKLVAYSSKNFEVYVDGSAIFLDFFELNKLKLNYTLC